jgi:hypothetical protein
MAGQIKNTLRSLLPPYQRNIATEDYEITLIENGSTRMLPERARAGPALRIPLSEYENIRVGALKARPGSRHPEEWDRRRRQQKRCCSCTTQPFGACSQRKGRNLV